MWIWNSEWYFWWDKHHNDGFTNYRVLQVVELEMHQIQRNKSQWIENRPGNRRVLWKLVYYIMSFVVFDLHCSTVELFLFSSLNSSSTSWCDSQDIVEFTNPLIHLVITNYPLTCGESVQKVQTGFDVRVTCEVESLGSRIQTSRSF